MPPTLVDGSTDYENLDPAKRAKRRHAGEQVDWKLLAGYGKILDEKYSNNKKNLKSPIINGTERRIRKRCISSPDLNTKENIDDKNKHSLKKRNIKEAKKNDLSSSCLLKLPVFSESDDNEFQDLQCPIIKNKEIDEKIIINEIDQLKQVSIKNTLNDNYEEIDNKNSIILPKRKNNINTEKTRERSRSPPTRLFHDNERSICLALICSIPKPGYYVDTYHSDHIVRVKLGSKNFPKRLDYVIKKGDCFVCRMHIPEEKKNEMKKCTLCDYICHPHCLDEMRFGSYIGKFAIKGKEENNKIVCPRHCCVKCFAERLHTRAFQGESKMVRCRYCMSHYHSDCIPAGCTISKKKKTIICPRHCYTKHFPKRLTTHCFECHNPDKNLINCSNCSRSYHRDCNRSVSYIPNSILGERCSFCADHNFVVVGDRVYAQFGVYGFHPAIVVSNDKFPRNIKIKPGELVLQWLEGYTYSILNHYNVIPCTEDIYFYNMASLKKVKDHKEWYRYVVENEHRLLKPLDNNHLRRRNGFCKLINKCIITPEAKTVWNNFRSKDYFGDKEVCTCSPGIPNRCNTNLCESRAMNIECSASCSTVEGGCSNRIDFNQFSKLSVRATDDRGFGLFCASEIKKDSYIGEYCGEIITVEEKEEREKLDKLWGSRDKGFYTFSLGGLYIDADYKGSSLRYANHSCEPNTLMKLVHDSNGFPHICMYAIKDINVDEEITFNYSGVSLSKKKNNGSRVITGIAYRCYCNSPNCTNEFTV